MMSRSRPHIHLQGDRKPRRYMHGWDGRTIVTEADEIRLLVTEIQRLEAEGAYLGVIIGGDFNFEPDDPEYLELERAGLRDTYMVASHESEVYSLDPQENLIAGQGVREVPSTLREAMKRLPESQQLKVLDGYQKGVSQARRVDFLFLMKKSAGKCSQFSRQCRRVGCPGS